MMMETKDLRALITGGNSGIGKAIAEAFAGLGIHCCVAGRNENANRQTADALQAQHGVRAAALTIDVSVEEDCARAVDETRRLLGGIDILVNNAGIHGGRRIEDSDTDTFDRTLKTNLYGAFWCARQSFRAMRENPIRNGLRGSIVNISSLAGKEAWDGTGAYSISKFGMMALTQSLADEGKEPGIRATAVCPALVATPMTGASGAEVLQPADIASTACWLLQLGPAAWPTEVVLPRRDAE